MQGNTRCSIRHYRILGLFGDNEKEFGNCYSILGLYDYMGYYQTHTSGYWKVQWKLLYYNGDYIGGYTRILASIIKHILP